MSDVSPLTKQRWRGHGDVELSSAVAIERVERLGKHACNYGVSPYHGFTAKAAKQASQHM